MTTTFLTLFAYIPNSPLITLSKQGRVQGGVESRACITLGREFYQMVVQHPGKSRRHLRSIVRCVVNGLCSDGIHRS